MLPLTFSKVDSLKESKETKVELKNSELAPFISLWRTSGKNLFRERKMEKSTLKAS